MAKLLGAILLACLAAGAANKAPARGEASNKALKIEATALLNKPEIAAALGHELDEGFIVLQVKLTALGGEPVKIWLDDFLLRSEKDGQKGGPFHPSQIAGSGTLMVGTRGGGMGIMGDEQGPVWGGIGGPPTRMGGNGGVIGNTGGPGEAVARVDTRKEQKENPLLDALKKKGLAEGELAQASSGLLYFLLEGKHKAKDLVLDYKGAAGKLSLRFQEGK